MRFARSGFFQSITIFVNMDGKGHRISFAAAALLAALVVFCRFDSQAADFYSLRIYPAVSAALSWVSSVVPFSLNDLAIAGLVIAALAILASAIFRKKRWTRCLARELELGLWVFVWFYAGWCTNYYRSDIFTRLRTQRSAYDEQVFSRFLDEYTAMLNESFDEASEGGALSPVEVEQEVKALYSHVPAKFGLAAPRKWQHPKPMLIRRVQSAVGVTGYMGPLAGEFHINSDVLPEDYPFTFAHEYSHLLGVSSEAEANWWAYRVCCSSDDPRMRYSGCYSILSHVWNNARRLLDEDSFREWRSSISPEIISALIAEGEYWDSKRIPALDKAQTFIYDLFLKANHVSSGIRNYSEVVQMIISLDEKNLNFEEEAKS